MAPGRRARRNPSAERGGFDRLDSRIVKRMSDPSATPTGVLPTSRRLAERLRFLPRPVEDHQLYPRCTAAAHDAEIDESDLQCHVP